jgi:Meiotically up-regulated gene 113
MAETKVSFVYLFSADGGWYKIGKSKDPEKRLLAFLGLPFNVKMLHAIATLEPEQLEQYFHKIYQHCRVHGEWFRLSGEDVESFVNFPNLPGPDKGKPEETLTVGQVAFRLGISTFRVWRLIRSGRLPAIWLEKAHRIRVADLPISMDV